MGEWHHTPNGGKPQTARMLQDAWYNRCSVVLPISFFESVSFGVITLLLYLLALCGQVA
mgnify:CR=1 FL=1